MKRCDCTSWCGDDPDLLKKTVQGCESYLDRTEPKRILIAGLQRQAALMQSNANYLEQLHPDIGQHAKLRRAAKSIIKLAKQLQEAT